MKESSNVHGLTAARTWRRRHATIWMQICHANQPLRCLNQTNLPALFKPACNLRNISPATANCSPALSASTVQHFRWQYGASYPPSPMAPPYPTPRQCQGGESRGASMPPQPDSNNHSMPQGDRSRRQHDRLCWRNREEGQID